MPRIPVTSLAVGTILLPALVFAQQEPIRTSAFYFGQPPSADFIERLRPTLPH